MPVSVRHRSEITTTETLGDENLSSADNGVTFALTTDKVLNAGSTPPATKRASFKTTLTAGVATIDLRALSGLNGGVVDGNGLKVQVLKFRGKSDNANPITVKEGAANGYELLGNLFTLDVKAGQEVTLFLNGAAPVISSTTKNIDLVGTGSQVLEGEIVMG